MKLRFCLTLAVFATVVAGCDIYNPQKDFRFAVSNDFQYHYLLSQIQPFLEQNGYEITVVKTERTIDANRLVAQGKADLTFVNNVSSHILVQLGADAATLQTIVPLTRRALLTFTKTKMPVSSSAREIFEGKVVGVEILNGEGHGIIANMFRKAQIRNVTFVQYDQSDFDVRVFWGTPYGPRARAALDAGLHLFSFGEDWVDFQTLSEPALRSETLPAIPGDPNSAAVSTVITDGVLVGNINLGEHAVYRLAQTFMQQKLSLVRQDAIYASISENISRETLLYPLHEGTVRYLRRDTPTFFERYADSLALFLSAAVLVIGAFQAFKSRMSRIKKDRIDEYFLEFLEIRSKPHASLSDKILLLDDLFQRAVVQMTNEKMEKNDFHIFSRLVQQEVTILRMNRPGEVAYVGKEAVSS